ncbi:MAG: hypothetical protein KDK24_04625 [Pseudooceanicola sp.]|nr:hypothetical protein [Pseudooceanicola sp.]
MEDRWCHTSSILVERPAPVAFQIMADGLKQGRWTWGSYERQEVQPGVFMGHSVFTGKETYVRLRPDPDRLLVDYDVGPSADSMRFRNSSRVIPGPALELGDNQSVITLLTWRLNSQGDAAWVQAGTIHEAEMFLIKGLLER